MARYSKKVEVLLVNDDPAFTKLVGLICLEKGIGRVTGIYESSEVLPYLRRLARYADAPPPDLILIDPYVPSSGGVELLKELRALEICRALPIMIMASCFTDSMLRQSYELGASACITMPTDFDKLASIFESLSTFWLKVAVQSRRLEVIPSLPLQKEGVKR